MESGILSDGFKLLVMGMGTVFVFLVLMICCMNLLKRVVEPWKHLLEPPAAPAKSARPGAKSGDDAAVAVAAAAALHLKRNQK